MKLGVGGGNGEEGSKNYAAQYGCPLSVILRTKSRTNSANSKLALRVGIPRALRWRTQYIETCGQRALYYDGGDASTLPYRTPRMGPLPSRRTMVKGPSGNYLISRRSGRWNNDLSNGNPVKLKEMQELFRIEAAKYQGSAHRRVSSRKASLRTRSPRRTVTGSA